MRCLPILLFLTLESSAVLILSLSACILFLIRIFHTIFLGHPWLEDSIPVSISVQINGNLNASCCFANWLISWDNVDKCLFLQLPMQFRICSRTFLSIIIWGLLILMDWILEFYIMLPGISWHVWPKYTEQRVPVSKSWRNQWCLALLYNLCQCYITYD